jgi:mRNA-degrading endonuclease toxin of MazEF toxin-antitoxin module
VLLLVSETRTGSVRAILAEDARIASWVWTSVEMTSAIERRARSGEVEVPITTDAGIDRPSVVNCDGLHTVPQRRLSRRLGSLDGEPLAEICKAIAVALGCDLVRGGTSGS